MSELTWSEVKKRLKARDDIFKRREKSAALLVEAERKINEAVREAQAYLEGMIELNSDGGPSLEPEIMSAKKFYEVIDRARWDLNLARHSLQAGRLLPREIE